MAPPPVRFVGVGMHTRISPYTFIHPYSPYMHIHTCACIYAYMLTRLHWYMHTRIHAYTYIAYMHTCIHAHAHTHICACTYTCRRACVYVHVHLQLHVKLHALIQLCIPIRRRICVHIRIHVRINIRCTFIYTNMSLFGPTAQCESYAIRRICLKESALIGCRSSRLHRRI